MTREQANKKARELVGRMTVEEMASQLRFDAPAIERLGIPAYNWWNEALHGLARVSVPTVFTASPAVIREAEKGTLAARLRSFGIVISYICPLMYMNNPLCKKKPVITCSNKLRTYTSARFYTEGEILDIITSKEGRI